MFDVRYNNKCFDLIISEQNFFCIDSKLKFKNDNEMNSLEKIEFIVENHLIYHIRVDDPVKVSQGLPLFNDCIEEVGKYLTITDLFILNQLNRRTKTQVEILFLKKAKELGYEGQNFNETIQYINNLFKEVHALTMQGIIKNKYIRYNKDGFELEGILQNLLKKLSSTDVFALLAKKAIYTSTFDTFRKIFHPNRSVEVLEESPIAICDGFRALVGASQCGEKNIVELLLKLGADQNHGSKLEATPLHYAAQSGRLDIVDILLKNGAFINKLAKGHSTALAFACGYGDKKYYNPNEKVVNLLLQYGADPNLLTEDGYSALQLARKHQLTEIVKLLSEDSEHLKKTKFLVEVKL